MNERAKEGSFKPIFFVMAISIFIAAFWDKASFIKDSVHFILDPSAGWLLGLNLDFGMLILVFLISLTTTLVQKYTTNQKALKELREEQKLFQEDIKKYQGNPEKMTEFSKKQMDFFKRTMKLSSRSIMFTGIPFILFFRWFNDIFVAMGNPKFFGYLSWFLFYLIFTMIFSTILRKAMKVV